jgi:hypothetical protein
MDCLQISARSVFILDENKIIHSTNNFVLKIANLYYKTKNHKKLCCAEIWRLDNSFFTWQWSSGKVYSKDLVANAPLFGLLKIQIVDVLDRKYLKVVGLILLLCSSHFNSHGVESIELHASICFCDFCGDHKQ